MKTITARLYASGSPLGRMTYETGEHNDLGKKMARVFLDEIVDWVRNICDKEPSWAVTFTDGDSELAFTSADKRTEMNIEIDGEAIGKANINTTFKATVMWDWMREKGWC